MVQAYSKNVDSITMRDSYGEILRYIDCSEL